jgi:hypothetical protein
MAVCEGSNSSPKRRAFTAAASFTTSCSSRRSGLTQLALLAITNGVNLADSLRMGAKGIFIPAPILAKKRAEQYSPEEGSATVAVGFRAVYVFDLADTDGEPLPELGNTQGDPAGYTERLKSFVLRRDIQLEYSDSTYPVQAWRM